MAQSILTHTGHVAPRRSVRRLTDQEMKKETEIAKRLNFDKLINDKLGDSMSLPSKENIPSFPDSSDPSSNMEENDEEEPLELIDGDPVFLSLKIHSVML